MLIYNGKSLNIKKYWDMDYPQEPITFSKSEDDYIEEFKSALHESVKLRLQSDVPVCCHLSGGIDSSAVAALASDFSSEPLDCFTVSFDHEGYDELSIAKEMAEKISAPLHVVSVSQDDLISAIPEAVYYSEGLSINGHLAGKFLLNKAIRGAGFKVALTGEGADEVLAGYPHLREDILHSADKSGLRDDLKALYRSNDKLAGVFLAHGDTLDTTAVEKALGYLPSFLKAKASLGFRVQALLSDDFKCDDDIYADLIHHFDLDGQLSGRHVVNQSSYLWTKLTLAGYILRTLGDGCEMAQSIEGRVPFLDHHLFEVTKALPMEMKIKDLKEKYILREAVKGQITDTIYKRQKHPFIAPPVSRFSNSGLNEYINDTLRSCTFQSMPFWDSGKVISWLENLPNRSDKDQAAAEPVLMMVLTSFVIHQKFKL
jgi:asparagine synthase (glutamine-hydrolysing)